MLRVSVHRVDDEDDELMAIYLDERLITAHMVVASVQSGLAMELRMGDMHAPPAPAAPLAGALTDEELAQLVEAAEREH